MLTGLTNMRAYRWYAVVVAMVSVVHYVLPDDARPISYTLVLASTIPPLALQLRRSPAGEGLPWWLMLIAMTTLTGGNVLIAVGGSQFRMASEAIVTVGHAVLLCAALSLVLRRGRNDLGGLIDASVVTMGVGALLWTSLLEPRLARMDAPVVAQVALFVSVFVLSGVIGSLGRLWVTAERRMPTLEMLIAAVLGALIGNTALAVTTGSMTVWRPLWVETVFMMSYLLVGAAALHPSANLLTHPGPVQLDRLSRGRLVFLGFAMMLSPVVGGLRVAVGLPADGLLIALGTLSVGSLVLIRIGVVATQRELTEKALVHEASHDGLTGLPNRVELLNRLEGALAREQVAGISRVVLLFCDLDGFKPVNDRLGHGAGDQLLFGIAGRISARLRAHETIARYGGDEFVLLCESVNQEQTAQRLMRDIEHALVVPFDLGGELVRVGASIGAVASDGRSTADELLRLADEAMYRAKEQRRQATARSPAPPAPEAIGSAVEQPAPRVTLRSQSPR